MKQKTKQHLIGNAKKLFGFKKKPTEKGINKFIEKRREPQFYPLAGLGRAIKQAKRR